MALSDAVAAIAAQMESITGRTAEGAVELGPRVRRPSLIVRIDGAAIERSTTIWRIQVWQHHQATSVPNSQDNIDRYLTYASSLADWLRAHAPAGWTVHWPTGIEIAVEPTEIGEDVIMTIPIAESY